MIEPASAAGRSGKTMMLRHGAFSLGAWGSMREGDRGGY